MCGRPRRGSRHQSSRYPSARALPKVAACRLPSHAFCRPFFLRFVLVVVLCLVVVAVVVVVVVVVVVAAAAAAVVVVVFVVCLLAFLFCLFVCFRLIVVILFV